MASSEFIPPLMTREQWLMRDDVKNMINIFARKWKVEYDDAVKRFILQHTLPCYYAMITRQNISDDSMTDDDLIRVEAAYKDTYEFAIRKGWLTVDTTPPWINDSIST